MTGGAGASQHYKALDAFRGLGAILVAFSHWGSYGLLSWPGFQLSGVIVDYFFVLSGFVIASTYHGRITDWASGLRFSWLRVGRIYPLHIATLALMIFFEFGDLIVDSLGLLDLDEPFTGQREAERIIPNLFLLQTFGIHQGLSWNGPAWSVAAEMWTYLIFAILTVVGGRYRYWTYAATIVICWAMLARWSNEGLYSTDPYAVQRCCVSFFAGVLLWRVFDMVRSGELWGRISVWAWTAIEAVAFMIPIYFTLFVGETTPLAYAAPLFTCIFVFIFAMERGRLSRLLSHRALVYLGTLSFSIYMLHRPLLVPVSAMFRVIESVTGLELTRIEPEFGRAFGQDGLQGDVMFIPFIVLVVVLSHLSYRYYEDPLRRWFKSKQIGRSTRAASPAAVG